MAGGQERILRRRIKSVQSTKKITRAMELIAASRIVKAANRVHAAAPYADGITAVVTELQAAGAGSNNPLLTPRPNTKRVAQIVITADRGLCGGYNTAVMRAAEAEIREHEGLGREYALFCVGRKAEGYFRFREYAIDAAFTGFSDFPLYEHAREIAAVVAGPFERGEIDLVQLVYTRFVTAGRQEVVVRPLLPLDREGFAQDSEGPQAGFEFEPEPERILEALLPRYAEARVFAALLNAAASEHAFRQRAMKAATENADELVLNLSRIMNRARQDAITTEIMEVVGGAEALRSGDDMHTSSSERIASVEPPPHAA